MLRGREPEATPLLNPLSAMRDSSWSDLSVDRELSRLPRRNFRMAGNGYAERGGQARSSRSIAIVDERADGEEGAEEEV